MSKMEKINLIGKCGTCNYCSGTFPEKLICNWDGGERETDYYRTCKHYEQIVLEEKDAVYRYYLVVPEQRRFVERVICWG